MREVIVPYELWSKIGKIKVYLLEELQLSEAAAEARIKRMRDFVSTFAKVADYPLCRFKQWQMKGYRCAVFEKSWVFAYEIFDGGVIIRDMSHTATLTE